jgi:hypothetical protein
MMKSVAYLATVACFITFHFHGGTSLLLLLLRTWEAYCKDLPTMFRSAFFTFEDRNSAMVSSLALTLDSRWRIEAGCGLLCDNINHSIYRCDGGSGGLASVSA